MRMISVHINLGLTGSTMFQRLMNGLMLMMVCPYILRVRVESFFFYCMGGGELVIFNKCKRVQFVQKYKDIFV